MEIVEPLRNARIDESEQIKSEGFIGSIRINPKNYTDAFVNNPEGGPDIYIEGIQSRKAALDGDIVRVKLNHISKWKLNHIRIANNWDELSQHLLPIIHSIELAEKAIQITAPPKDELQKSTTNHIGCKSKEVKDSPIQNDTSRIHKASKGRATNSDSTTKKAESKKYLSESSSKLPSNLPLGISKLKIKDVLDFPFSSQFIQKTGYVIEVVKKNHLGVAGGFLRPHSEDKVIFSPTDSRVPRMLIDLSECPLDFSTQPDRYRDVLFIAQITSWGGNKYASGSLVKIVGDANNIQSRMEALLMENQIYDEDFCSDVYEELDYLKNLPNNWFSKNSLGRRDLTNECIFTIDPKTARDLDDAVSIKRIAEQIYEVGVHIADVSYFVEELTAVDYYARLRTTSVYLVDRVIPMLPRILCEQMCSLNPGQPKLTFSVIWKMDKYGRIIDTWFGRTVIKSCVKLAYEQAQDLIDKPNDIAWIKEGVNMPKLFAFNWKHISKSVLLLNKIAQNLRSKRFQDGALRIEQVKLKYELDPSTGFPTGFTFESRCPANFLIEEYMLLANMSVAKRIYQHNKDSAFLRRHPASSITTLKEVKEFCDAKGCPLDITSSGSIQKSLNAIKDPTISKVVSFLLLRAMLNAEYVCAGALTDEDGKNFSHFALNVPYYTHFTSPIRRYADVIVHRLLSIAVGYSQESNEDVQSLRQVADECTKRKISSKLISDKSQQLYFNLFIQRAGFCELLACVTRIYDQSFDVILIDYDRAGRVYLDKLKPRLASFKFEIFSCVKRLVLNWEPPANTNDCNNKKKKKAKNRKKVVPNQIESLSHVQKSKTFLTDAKISVNEPVEYRQVIEVFDVVRVIVTTDEKDITQLKINLKTPDE